jgi:hypothetical protein
LKSFSVNTKEETVERRRMEERKERERKRESEREKLV